MDLTFGIKTYIFLQFCLLSVKRMKNRDLNPTDKTARILDSNPCLQGSFVPPETLWIPDLTSPTPPPHFTYDKYLISQNIHGFCQYSVLSPARPLIRWHPTRGVFVVFLSVVTLILSSTLLFVSGVATFGRDAI